MVSRIAVLVALLACPSVWAQDDGLHLRLETSLRSAYLTKVGILAHDEPSWVNDLTISSQHWYAGIWSTAGCEDDQFGDDRGDELDWYVGWKQSYGRCDFDLTATYLQLYRLDQGRNDLLAFDAKATWTGWVGFQPYLQLRRFEPAGSQGPDDGWFLFAGIQRRQPLWFSLSGSVEKQSLLIDVSSAYSDGALGRAAGIPWWRIKLSTDVSITSSLSVSPSVLWQFGAGDQDGLPDDYTNGNQAIYGLSLKYRF